MPFVPALLRVSGIMACSAERYAVGDVKFEVWPFAARYPVMRYLSGHFFSVPTAVFTERPPRRIFLCVGEYGAAPILVLGRGVKSVVRHALRRAVLHMDVSAHGYPPPHPPASPMACCRH